MDSLVLRTAARWLTWLLLAFSLFLLLRGHDQPGGGFVGGLVAAAALSLRLFALGPEGLQILRRLTPPRMLTVGLGIAAASGLAAAARGEPFLSARWTYVPIALGELHLGTPLLFDLGVYLTVVGFVLLFLIELQGP